MAVVVFILSDQSTVVQYLLWFSFQVLYHQCLGSMIISCQSKSTTIWAIGRYCTYSTQSVLHYSTVPQIVREWIKVPHTTCIAPLNAINILYCTVVATFISHYFQITTTSTWNNAAAMLPPTIGTLFYGSEYSSGDPHHHELRSMLITFLHAIKRPSVPQSLRAVYRVAVTL